MEIRPFDIMLLYKEAMQLSVCCDCYLRECDTCPANATKEKFKELVKEVNVREKNKH